MQQPYMLPILYWQHHACWCSGDFRSQGISRYGIDSQSRNIPSSASEELTIPQPIEWELTGLSQVGQTGLIDWEVANSGPVLWTHVGNGGAIGNGQLIHSRAEELDELPHDSSLSEMFGDGEHDVGGCDQLVHLSRDLVAYNLR